MPKIPTLCELNLATFAPDLTKLSNPNWRTHCVNSMGSSRQDTNFGNLGRFLIVEVTVITTSHGDVVMPKQGDTLDAYCLNAVTRHFSMTKRNLVGWIAVTISLMALLFWSYWGSIEAFYEGWYHNSVWKNLALTIVQYLSPVLILMIPAVAGVLWPRVGAVLHWLLALMAFEKINTPAGRVLIALPLAVTGILYWFGRVQPRKWAVYGICCLPVVAVIVCGAVPAYMVYERVDDGYRGMRVVEGNGVRLRWAPAGPGWPERGGDWYRAQQTCSRLSADGSRVADQPGGVWRLPTADELARSMTLHGRNAGGLWNQSSGTADFQLTPDKESPLWNPYSLVIYWWTGTELQKEEAYRFSYNGRSMATPKKARAAYYGFRCVAQP